MKRASELTATQWQIAHYARLSNFAMAGATFVVWITYATFTNAGSAYVATAASIAAVVGAGGWLILDRWLQQQILCPVCKQSLHQRWVIEVWVGFWSWFGGLPDKCRHCGARLP